MTHPATVGAAALLVAATLTASPPAANAQPRTVGHVHRLLHRVCGHAVKWGVITANPISAAEPPRVVRPEIRILSPEEIKTVLAAMRAGQVPDAALATHRMQLADVPRDFAALLDPDQHVIKAIVEC